MKDQTAMYIVENDPDFARDVLVHNLYGKEVCGWGNRDGL